MTKRLSRRQLLRSGLVLGAGAGLGLPRLLSLQGQEATPEASAQAVDDAYLPLDGSIRRVHDPVIIKADDIYYLFCTGDGIPVRQSADLINWEQAFPASVFNRVPEWTHEILQNRNDLWAPAIAYFNDRYHLYYSVSSFGVNRSAIGVATNVTLDSSSDDFEWVDQGMVFESTQADWYNAIDPHIILDEDGVPWMSFGSFWGGIKLLRLDPETGKPSAEDDTLYSLAQRTANSGAVEAPTIIRKGDFYYLFVSFDFCCRGVDSSYHVMVGRSESITGPYVDREGVEMMDGGGTQVTFPTERWRGPGHNDILQEGDQDYIVHHAYDAESNGIFTLRIAPLTWDDEGWPSIAPIDEA